MAEILGIIAFPIAAHDTVVAFYKAGKLFYEQIEAYKNAPKTVIKFQDFAQSLHEGDLADQVEVTEWMFQQHDIKQITKDKISSLLQELRDELLKIDEFLQNSFEKDTKEFRRTTFTVWYKAKLLKSLAALDGWKEKFWREVSIVETMRNILPDPLLLSSPKPFAPQYGDYNVPFEDGCSLYRGKAELVRDNKIVTVTVLIEHLQAGGEASPEVKEIAQELAGVLYKPNKGILRCLGYRIEPEIQLVFEFPSGFDNPRTLRSLLLSSGNLNINFQCPLDYRFRLAKELQNAVFSVHTQKFVHKNIRPDSIVLFSKTDTTQKQDKARIVTEQFSPAYLTDWKMLRNVNEPTWRKGDTDWTRNFYRHHDRQGLKPQKRYALKHDVYTLGVCLLEIGLWDSFIVDRGTSQTPNKMLSDFFLSAALQTGLIEPDDMQNMDAFCASRVLQAVLVAIAKQQLPQRMGIAFGELVVACLTNAEGGFGDKGDFDGDATDIATKFNDLILQACPQIVTGSSILMEE